MKNKFVKQLIIYLYHMKLIKFFNLREMTEKTYTLKRLSQNQSLFIKIKKV